MCLSLTPSIFAVLVSCKVIFCVWRRIFNVFCDYIFNVLNMRHVCLRNLCKNTLKPCLVWITCSMWCHTGCRSIKLNLLLEELLHWKLSPKKGPFQKERLVFQLHVCLTKSQLQGASQIDKDRMIPFRRKPDTTGVRTSKCYCWTLVAN